MGNIGFKELIVILLLVLLLFGAKKLKNIATDLGAAVKGFKKSVNEGEEEEAERPRQLQADRDAEFPEMGRSAQDQKSGDRRSA